MNKEEIETLLNKCDNCKITDIQKIKEYVRNLEITNEELDKECSRLEQKDFRLYKVTDKLKEEIRELEDAGGAYYAQKIMKILNIIEGEKK